MVAKTICPVCGDEVEVKEDKKGRPFFRCKSCLTVVFTYSELGAEALASGAWPFAGEGEPEPPKLKPASRPVSEAPENKVLVQEVKRLSREVAGLKSTMKGPRTGLDLIKEKQKSLSV